jgi:hypothetical protein
VEIFFLGFLAGAGVVAGVAAFLWRRGALALDRDKAKAGVDSVMGDIQRDVHNWRDKLGK